MIHIILNFVFRLLKIGKLIQLTSKKESYLSATGYYYYSTVAYWHRGDNREIKRKKKKKDNEFCFLGNILAILWRRRASKRGHIIFSSVFQVFCSGAPNWQIVVLQVFCSLSHLRKEEVSRLSHKGYRIKGDKNQEFIDTANWTSRCYFTWRLYTDRLLFQKFFEAVALELKSG